MKSPRFHGLSLSDTDRATLRSLQGGAQKMSARRWRRVRVLLLLDERWTVRETAKAVGSYPREISRVGKRYVARGLEAALSDDMKPTAKPLLDSTQEAAIVAMVCGPAPEGRARWTVRLVAKETVRRAIAPKVGRETVRVVLAEHGLKPWR